MVNAVNVAYNIYFFIFTIFFYAIHIMTYIAYLKSGEKNKVMDFIYLVLFDGFFVIVVFKVLEFFQ